MFENLEVNHVINPVTALAFAKFRSRLLLLAGEGPYLKVFDHETTRLLDAVRVFESQAVHGITTSEFSGSSNGATVVKLLVWGNRCLRLGQLHDDAATAKPKMVLELRQEVQADDWILDVCFLPDGSDAVFVTAHDVVFHLINAPGGQDVTLRRVADGPKSMLYSACIDWSGDGRVLVAAGTVFGEVLLWSISEPFFEAGTISRAQSQLHYRFTGHEGSVFGVRISPLLSGFCSEGGRRFVASCSDDRTIRLWDVSSLDGHEATPGENIDKDEASIESLDDPSRRLARGRCVATVMGHVSRIWNVRFLVSGSRVDIASFGEDGTAQSWQLSQKPLVKNALTRTGLDYVHLTHRQTYACHSGKNIWASALFQTQDGSHIITTGGGDGRIVSYDVNRDDDITKGGTFAGRWTMEEVEAVLEEPGTSSTDGKQASLSERIFNALVGDWIIKRDIRSALPTYPSGTFSGEAYFKSRSPSSKNVDKEYLYAENGTFSTDRGLTFQATKQYVYTYQRASDTVCAYFVKPEDGKSIDYLFHKLQLEESTEAKDSQNGQDEYVVKASSYHLCVEDHYTPRYSFHLRNGIVHDWDLMYEVKGPQKDYVTTASYTRRFDGGNRDSGRSHGHHTCGIDRASKEGLHTTKDVFKSYTFLTHSAFLVTTAQGKVILGSSTDSIDYPSELPTPSHGGPRVRWELIARLQALTSWSMTTRVVGSELVLISGTDGVVFWYGSAEQRIRPAFELHRKAAFLYAQKVNEVASPSKGQVGVERHLVLATCLGIPEAHVSNRRGNLSLPESFLVTSACYVEVINAWMLGSRNGALAIYDTSLFPDDADLLEPSFVLQNIHGEDAITVIQCLPEQKTHQSVYILTAGRDGHYAVYNITTTQKSHGQEFTLLTVHRSTPTFGPNIEGAAFHQRTHELLLWGFRSTQFVVWNASKNMETMTIECGGAHRHWSYIPRNNGGDGGTFVWTQASVCHVHSQAYASHQVFQSGGHGREIKAMTLSPILWNFDSSSNQYIATGAEDTAIRIWSYDRVHGSTVGFKCLGTFTKHTAGIQQMQWSDDGRLLFSAAGCEEFLAWRVRPVPWIGVGAVCEAVCPKVSGDGDLRIMDFCLEEINNGQQENQNHKDEARDYRISIVYSDSSLRIFHYTSHSTRGGHFTLLRTGTYTTNCLTQILSLPQQQVDPSTQSYLLTASSDGHIALWPFSSPSLPSSPSSTTAIFSAHRHPIHQSAIKSLALIPPSSTGNGYLLLSAGDDGALGITRLTLPPITTTTPSAFPSPCPSLFPAFSTLLYPKAHAAAINALASIKTLPCGPFANSSLIHTFVTSGNDQRVKTWRVEFLPNRPGTQGLRLKKLGDRPTSVGDVAAVGILKGDGEGGRDIGVLVAGIGMECLPVVEKGVGLGDEEGGGTVVAEGAVIG
ncbi:MAG: hypothetical protein Q9208_006008 [Pyrenodesmia sp. 3 TL-2023]